MVNEYAMLVKKQMKTLKPFVFIGLVFTISQVHFVSAATINVSNLSQNAVQIAIDAAGPGDIILLPSGSTTWTSTVTLTTGLTLRGQGSGSTTIKTTSGTDGLIINDDCIVEDLAFIQADSAAPGDEVIKVNDSQDFIIRNISITNISRRGITSWSSRGSPHATGVIHDCTITAKSYPSSGDGVFQLFQIQGSDGNSPPSESTGTGSLKYDPGFGTANAIFIEDCTLSQDAAGDASVELYTGGKAVVRHNTMTNFTLGIHGNDSSIRTGHSAEIYNNTIHNDTGTSHEGIVKARGGTGVVWGNTITNTGATNSNKIVLKSYRTVFDPFSYNSGQLDGSYAYDGNTPVTDGTGTHDGPNNSAVLSDSGQSWTTNFYLGDGGTSSPGDYLQTYYVWNRTDGSGGFATANTSTTFTCTLTGGVDNDWDVGDVYVITNGYPGLDQVGWTGPTVFYGTYSTQTLNPWYAWDNTYNGSGGLSALPFKVDYMNSSFTSKVQPDSSVMIKENREYFNNTAKPGYIPYPYPHPLRGTSTGPTPPDGPTDLNLQSNP